MGTLDGYRVWMTAQGYAADTVRARVRVVELAAEHGGVDPGELDEVGVRAWLGSAPRADWTRLKYLQHVRAWCVWDGIPDATAGVRRPRTPVGVPKPVPELDLNAMLHLATPRARAWLLLGAFCGLRSFETAKVAAEDLEQAPDGARLLRVRGKGGQVAVVPCPPVVFEELRSWVAAAGGHGPLWPGTSRYAVQSAIRRCAAKAGTVYSSHQLRHRYGTAVYAASGGDLLATQKMMRHRSPATTAGYALVASDHLSAVAAALPGAAGLSGPGARLRLVTGGASG
jgi:integrase